MSRHPKLRKHELPTPPNADQPSCKVFLEGRSLEARVDEPLMVTLLAHGIVTASRSVKYHRPRGAFCLDGTCGRCCMRIDDLPGRPACLAPAREGATLFRENAFPTADLDVFRAADWLFPDGLDHHRLGTTPSRAVNVMMQGTARHMAGLGELSTRACPPPRPIEECHFDVAIVGGGPAGLSAARRTAACGLRVVLIEKRASLGGCLASGLYADIEGLARLHDDAAHAVESRHGETWTRALVAGIYEDERGPLLLVHRNCADDPDEQLVIVRAPAIVLATGGYEQSALFESNDLPGHYGARAFADLVFVHHVLPSERIVIADDGGEFGVRLARRLSSIGIGAARVTTSIDAPASDALFPGSRIVAARGGRCVRGVDVAPVDRPDDILHIPCDVIASALRPSPAYELAEQAGCALDWDPTRGGFIVRADERGATSRAGIYAAGELVGAATARESERHGEAAGLSAAMALERGSQAPIRDAADSSKG